MDFLRRTLVVGVVFAACTGALLGQEGATPAAKPQLTPEEMEAFLLKAKVANRREAGSGVTGSSRVTLTDGRLTHDAHVQAVDIARPVFEAGKATELNFKDSYRCNIAGYRLARLIGLTNVPMSVERNLDGKIAAVTWWVDDVMMDEKGRAKKKTMGPDAQRFAKQIQVMKIWDELIQNKDRNQGNILWTSDWSMWLIDHTRAFRLGRELVKPNDLTRCDRHVLEGMRAMTAESLAKAVGDSLTKDEQAAVLARRDVIVKRFDDRVATLGEGVLFTL